MEAIPGPSSRIPELKKAGKSTKKGRDNSNKMPTMKEMVFKAIEELQTRKGVSNQLIKKYVTDHYDVDVRSMNLRIKNVLIVAVESGVLLQMSGRGASGSFKLANKKKETSAKKKKEISPTQKKEAVGSNKQVKAKSGAMNAVTGNKKKGKIEKKKLIRGTITKRQSLVVTKIRKSLILMDTPKNPGNKKMKNLEKPASKMKK